MLISGAEIGDDLAVSAPVQNLLIVSDFGLSPWQNGITILQTGIVRGRGGSDDDLAAFFQKIFHPGVGNGFRY